MSDGHPAEPEQSGNDPAPGTASTAVPGDAGGSRAQSRSLWLRRTLNLSQKEAVASATMTATGDNFFNAFCHFLQASALQMGWLTAIPQLFGALCQILSAWLGNYLPRKPMVVATAVLQTVVVVGLVVLAVAQPEQGVWWLILLAVMYFGCINFIQPQWRAGWAVLSRSGGAALFLPHVHV